VPWVDNTAFHCRGVDGQGNCFDPNARGLVIDATCDSAHEVDRCEWLRKFEQLCDDVRVGVVGDGNVSTLGVGKYLCCVD